MKFMKKHFMYFIGIITSVVFALVLAIPALAWYWEGGRTTLGELTYKFQDDTSTSIRAAFISSYLSWENAVYYVDFTSTDGNPDFLFYEQNAWWFPAMEGMRDPFGQYPLYTQAQCWLNTYLVTQPQYDSYRRQGAAGHEIGHGLGLEHNEYYSIMDWDGSRRYYTWGIYTPTVNDISALNMLYPW